MSPWKSAQPGDPASAIDTPALVLDLDAFERNLKRMADAVRGSGVRLRPPAKRHKGPEIAPPPPQRRQHAEFAARGQRRTVGEHQLHML